MTSGTPSSSALCPRCGASVELVHGSDWAVVCSFCKWSSAQRYTAGEEASWGTAKQEANQGRAQQLYPAEEISRWRRKALGLDCQRKRLLVIGGLGHIGSAILRQWPAQFGDDITVVDNLATQRLCSLLDLPRRVRFLEADFLEADLPALLEGCDCCIHLGALTDAAGSIGRDEEYTRVNAEGVNVVAAACRQVGVPLLWPSTTSIYGTQDAPVDESMPPWRCSPGSPYAQSKLGAELILNEFHGPLGLQYTILRLGTIYGMSAGWRHHTAINRFCWQAAFGQPLTVYRGALDALRPYLWLDDALTAFRRVLDDQRFSGETFNVLSGNHTVAEVVACIREFLPETRVVEVDAPQINQTGYEVRTASPYLRLPQSEAARKLREGVGATLRALRPDLSLP